MTSGSRGQIDRQRRRLLQVAPGLPFVTWPIATRSAESARPVVATSYGRIRGIREGSVATFKGIPYGANTATTRFRRPQPPAGWSGVRDTVEYGPRCPQLPRPESGPRRLLQGWSIVQQESEDCLHLNVWTSGTAGASRKPVMVWIHGGGFASGSGAATVYEGNRLVEKGDVVVVTVNHRLNVFGFLCLAHLDEDFADSGNVGQFDLIAALHWIRVNIGQFGGDPDNVTIFGESGGGAKISTLMAMEEASGLFHRAVIQSGPMLWASEMASAQETGELGATAIGATRGRLHELDTASTQTLLECLESVRAAGRFRTLAPVVDGRGLTRHPFASGAADISADVPLMIGSTATESTFLLGFDESLFHLEWEDVPARLARHAADIDYNEIVPRFRELDPAATASDVFFDISTMYMIGRSTTRIADAAARRGAAPVWLYELTFETDADGGKWRSPHTLDIPLVFDNVSRSGAMFVDTGRAQAVATMMSDAWIAFARDGNPNVAGTARWQSWSREQPTRLFDTELATVDGPRKAKAEILRDLPYWDITLPNAL